MRIISDFGDLGTTSGVQRPIDFLVQKDGAVWNLTGYTGPVMKVWDIVTKTAVVITGALSVVTAVDGAVRYTPGVGDPLFANSGVYEAICYFTPAGGGDPEPSSLFRFSIVDAPAAS